MEFTSLLLITLLGVARVSIYADYEAGHLVGRVFMAPLVLFPFHDVLTAVVSCAGVNVLHSSLHKLLELCHTAAGVVPAHKVFQLGPDELDGVQLTTVGSQPKDAVADLLGQLVHDQLLFRSFCCTSSRSPTFSMPTSKSILFSVSQLWMSSFFDAVVGALLTWRQ